MTGAILLAGMAALLVWATAGLTAQARAPGPASLDTVVGLTAAGGAAGCIAWLAGGAVLTILGALPGTLARTLDDVAVRTVPVAWRRTIHLALGISIAAGPVAAAPAWADHGATQSAAPVSGDAQAERIGDPTFHAWDALPRVDRPAPGPGGDAWPPPIDRPADAGVPATWTPRAPPGPTPVAAPASPLLTGNPRPALTAEEDVIVRRGDTLWDIAARYLGPDASAAEITVEWPRWWNTNRDVIGSNPDLILPGQILRPPI